MMYSAHIIALVFSYGCVRAFAPSTSNKRHSSYVYVIDPKKDREVISNDIQSDVKDPTCPAGDEDCLVISSYSSIPELSDAALSQSLQRRSRYLAREPVLKNWRYGMCPTTKVSISSSDAVRRVCMDHYPLVACGSASGRIYLVNLEEATVVSSVQAHLSTQNDVRGSSDEVKRQAMEKLYGKLDGGGVVSIAMQDNVIASSGREGGVRLWMIKDKDGDMQLVPFGSLATLKNTIVTSVKFDAMGLLWVSCYDGTVRCYNITHLHQEPMKPIYQTDFTDSVLDMHLCEELKIGVCATSDGGAALFSLKDGQFFVGIMLFGVAARSVSIVKHDDEINVDMNGNREISFGYSVLCGGMDGTIHCIPLNISSDGRVVMNDPFAVTDETNTAIKPRHTGPVMCISSPGNGMFVSGGQDGALRVWAVDGLEKETPQADEQRNRERTHTKCKCVYALTGYKLWLGSACTDGDKLVSDGGENNIIVRDYSKPNSSQS